ncbi:MAG: hypothetical protein AAGF94_18060 [Pseudomonadota bacterium]
MFRWFAIAAFGMCVSFVGQAKADVVSFTFDAGPVTFRAENLRPNMAFFSDFIVGETIFVTITIDDQLPDLRPLPFRGRYVDRITGGATIRGGTSGTTFDITNGIEIELDQPNEIDFTSPPLLGAPNINTILFDEPNGGDIDIRSRFFLPITLRPSVLENVIAGFTRKLTGAPDFRFNRLQLDQMSEASIIIFNLTGPREVLSFGPVPGRSGPAPVPLPATLPMLGGAIAVIGLGAHLRARRKRA